MHHIYRVIDKEAVMRLFLRVRRHNYIRRKKEKDSFLGLAKMSKSRWDNLKTSVNAAATISSKTKARKAQRGVPLNIMVVGQSGLGKSTFVRTLVGTDMIPHRDYEQYNDLGEKTVDITSYVEDIDADGQKVILTVVDTPGFGDNINNSKSFVRILEFVESQHKRFLAEESRVQRNAKFQDTRIHVILYFIPPTGHFLRDLDIVLMKQLGKRANILPVIAKADSLLPGELKEFKQRLMEDMHKHDIPVFDFPVNSEDDDDIVQENIEFRANMPFAIVSSDFLHEIDGESVPARQYPWGTVVVENEQHCDFSKLKFVLLSSHLEVLKEVTNDTHYENFRQESLQKTGSLDSAKIEQELQEIERIEKEQKEKEQAERERRIALKQEKKRQLSSSSLLKLSDKTDDDDMESIASDESKKKKKAKSKKTDAPEDEDKKEKKKKKKDKDKDKEKTKDGEEEDGDDD